jgi:hypothetical protein
MKTAFEHRKSKRFDHKETVMLEHGSGRFFCYGQILNYSFGGICVSSQTTYNKGTPTKIRFGKPLYKAAPSVFPGTVRWCKDLSRNNSEFSYGVGIKYD